MLVRSSAIGPSSVAFFTACLARRSRLLVAGAAVKSNDEECKEKTDHCKFSDVEGFANPIVARPIETIGMRSVVSFPVRGTWRPLIILKKWVRMIRKALTMMRRQRWREFRMVVIMWWRQWETIATRRAM